MGATCRLVCVLLLGGMAACGGEADDGVPLDPLEVCAEECAVPETCPGDCYEMICVAYTDKRIACEFSGATYRDAEIEACTTILGVGGESTPYACVVSKSCDDILDECNL